MIPEVVELLNGEINSKKNKAMIKGGFLGTIAIIFGLSALSYISKALKLKGAMIAYEQIKDDDRI